MAANWRFITSDMAVALDFTRFAAAEAVTIGHAAGIFGVAGFLQHPHLPHLQHLGVYVFFFLSGLLICTTVMNKKNSENYSFLEYLIDRFARIYTGLLPALAVIFVVDYVGLHFWGGGYGPAMTNSHAYGLVGNLLMLESNQPLKWLASLAGFAEAYIEPFGSARPLWTLPIEWWTYLFFGWLALNKAEAWKRISFWPWLVLFSVVPAWQFLSGFGQGMLSFLWFSGALMAVIFAVTDPHQISKPILIFSATAVFAVIVARYKYVVGNNSTDLQAALLIGVFLFFFLSIFRTTGKFTRRASSVVKMLADFSFTMYLIHYSVCIAVFALVGEKPGSVTGFVAAILLSNLLAAAVAVLGEVRHKQVGRMIKARFGVTTAQADGSRA